MENWSKIALFSPKMSQKAPRDPLGPPMTMKIIFLRCQDMKTIWQKKEFLVYLPQKKSWSDQTMRSAAILVFRRYGCRPHRNLAVEFTFFNQYYVLDHLKQKNGCSGGGVQVNPTEVPLYQVPERLFWPFVKNGGNIFDHKADTLGIILSPISGLQDHQFRFYKYFSSKNLLFWPKTANFEAFGHTFCQFCCKKINFVSFYNFIKYNFW